MGELTAQQEQNELMDVIGMLDGSEELPLPFEQDIFLIGTQIAGTSYVKDIMQLYHSLKEGDYVDLVREPDNEYDEYAIRITTTSHEQLGYFPNENLPHLAGEKIGYVPAYNNKILARLMDAGKYLYGRVRAKEILNGDFYRIVVKIYMKD